MMTCTTKLCVKNAVSLSGVALRQMTDTFCSILLSSPRFLFTYSRNFKPKCSYLAVSKLALCGSSVEAQVPRVNCYRNNSRCLTGGSWKRRVEGVSVCRVCRKMSLRVCRKITFRTGAQTFSPLGFVCAGLVGGMLVLLSNSSLVHAEASREDKSVDASSEVVVSHGKKVHTNYSVIGIPGDGRCLFRSVVHGACLQSGKPPPSENLQRELADELRARVVDEFLKRREETEWFIEGDFDAYVCQMRKPHVWGGEPELLMASHVLQMPITVYMHDENSGGLISIAEYGQEYGKRDPIQVLYHGFGHYDALQFPHNKIKKAKL